MRDYLKFLRHYLDFKGHSSVSEFCNAFLWYIITGFVIVILSGIVLIGCFSMSAERASDLSQTFISIFGWIALLPCIGLLYDACAMQDILPELFFGFWFRE